MITTWTKRQILAGALVGVYHTITPEFIVNQPVQLDQRSFKVSWSSTRSNPTFYVYQDGRLISTTSATEMIFTVENGEALIVEILDDVNAIPITAFPGRMTLGWRTAPASAHYRIEESISSVWTLRAEITDAGQGFFTWKTRFLEDVTTHQFRVVPVGTNGNNGTALSFTALMVRHPDPPTQNFAYSDTTKKLTVT